LKKTAPLIFLAILLLPLASLAGAESLSQIAFSEKRAAVVVVSPDWRDAYLASVLAQNYGMPVRFVQDLPQMQAFLDELATGAFDTAIVLSKKGNELPSISLRIRSADANVIESEFADYKSLSKDVAEKMAAGGRAGYAVIVRDDFAFDALSAKYLSFALGAPVLFSRGTESIHGETLEALSATKPAKVYVFGSMGPAALSQLSAYEFEQVGGRDEFETSRKSASIAMGLGPLMGKQAPRQMMITPGDILDQSLLNSGNQPILIVPYSGTYSLLQLSQFVNETGALLLVGIGQGVADSGAYVRQRTGVRVMVKLGRVRAQGTEQMNKRDIVSALEGYALPLPNYNGTLEVAPATFADTVGAGGEFLFGAKKTAPPMVLHARYTNNGNIASPVTVSFSVSDKNGISMARFESEELVVQPGQTREFSTKWADAPSEGTYGAEAFATINVYEGVAAGAKKIGVELNWFNVWFGIGALILLAALAATAVYYSYLAREKLKRVEKMSGGMKGELEKMSIKLSEPAKDHAREKEYAARRAKKQ
jgi:hypothetical protein